MKIISSGIYQIICHNDSYSTLFGKRKWQRLEILYKWFLLLWNKRVGGDFQKALQFKALKLNKRHGYLLEKRVILN